MDLQCLRDQLLSQLKEALSKAQTAEISVRGNLNRSEIKHIAEIMKEKARVLGELVNELSDTNFCDYPVSLLHGSLRLVKELVHDHLETEEIRKADQNNLENAVTALEDEDRKEELLSKITNDTVENHDDWNFRKMVNKAFVENRNNVNYVLEKIFGTEQEEMRNILFSLCEASSTDDKYISIQDFKEEHVEFLLNSCLCETDPNDGSRIKLMQTY